MKIVFIISLIVAAVGAVAIEKLLDQEWETFKIKFNKSYESDIEDGFRKKIFLQNRYKITLHNKKFELGQVSYELGMNKFGDMLNSEFVDIMNGFNRTKKVYRYGRNFSDDAVTFIPPENIQVPDYIDWRTKGAVTPIKNQGQCGSCWAFSATGSLEGQHFRKTHKLVSLSEQNLVDCSDKYGNDGCDGGLMDNAFAYVKANHGIDTENSYPYEAMDDKCRYKPANSGATDKGYVDIESGNEKKLQQAVATVGPISVAIDASTDGFQLYKRGVFYDEDCSSEALDHGVLAVGYGTEKKSGKDYWIVKNSWGEDWGDDGYILMSRNRDNNCGIATQASYPVV